MGKKGNSEDKVRLDILVSELGYGRGFAKELILNGSVSVNGKPVLAPGISFIRDEANIVCSPPENIYVSRGGYKLEEALEYFNIDVKGLVCADIGASTGGFTDCLLKNGAKRVYAVDNGVGQLDKSLLSDSRVVNMENVNAKELAPDMFPEIIDFVCIDVSFISVTKIVPVIAEVINKDGLVVCLVKPQFEAGRGNVGKRGIVKDPKIHELVLKNVNSAFEEAGLVLSGTVRSPIKGADGNIEYLSYFVKK